jgi:signal transduction histidine kinase
MAAIPQQPRTRFISLRWRFLLPLFLLVLVAAMAGAYFLGDQLAGDMNIPQVNILVEHTRSVVAQATDLYERDRGEAERLAYTRGMVEMITGRQTADLQPLLESTARLAGLDSVIVTDAQGGEIVGLLRGGDESRGYSVSSDTDLSQDEIIQSVRDGGYIGATGLQRTPEGLMLYTAAPVNADGQKAGIVLVGRRLESVLGELAGGLTDVALYGENGDLLQTTLDTTTESLAALALTPERFRETLTSSGRQVPIQTFNLGDEPYQAAYTPFVYGPNTLGVFAVLAPDNIPFITEMGRQLSSLTLASIAGITVIGVFVLVNSLVVGRVNRVTRTAQALAAGNAFLRTGMPATDEIGAMGAALDQYADYVQERQDALRVTLRRQRREAEHLMAVLEAMPDGIIVQDLDGQVMMMNEPAKKLLGSARVFRDTGLGDLTASVTDVLGASLAPGLYALGDPQRVDVDGKMLQAQAAAVVDLSDQRVGTVVVLRDITDQVRRERAQELLVNRVEQDVQKPMAQAAQLESSAQPVNDLARELSRHAVALQKLVVEMRELLVQDAPAVREGYRPLHLETLIWTVANEWRQVAAAANLTLDVMIEKKGLYILGDERRLRWAIGNMLDNSIKYTPPGGRLTLEIKGEGQGKANLRIRDNGVGIAPDDLPHVFTRFYRGTPMAENGRVIRVPGTGQGLSTAKQLIEAHGGMVVIKSKPGVGTAVYFTLPLTSPVSLELPHLQMDMEGETVRLETDEI